MWLEHVAQKLGVEVVAAYPLTDGWAEYDSAAHLIRMHPQLRGVPAKSILAHELGHAAYKHDESTTQTERQADDFAQWLLIPFCQFLKAARSYESAQAVAHELGVLPGDVERYAKRVAGS